MDFGTAQKILPKNLAHLIENYNWQEIFVGRSNAKVFRLISPNKNVCYLKIASRLASSNSLLMSEKSKLEWLKNKLPVPEVLMFAENASAEFLLLSEIAGKDASDSFFKRQKRETIEQLANGLKKIHSLPVKDCPFDARLDYKIELARKRLENNLVDESDFDESRTGRNAEDLFRELVEVKPDAEDLVFTHGDYCLPNIILENGKLVGFVDLGSAGVADKYQDIALAARSLESNFGEKAAEMFFEIYGVKPDAQKLHFYQLLDEFF